MAVNLRWVLDQLGRNGRVVVWAHNAHIQKIPIDIQGLPAPAISLGTLLARSFGDRYVAIGTTVGRIAGDTAAIDSASIDAMLARAGKPLALVNLRGAPGGEVGAWLAATHPMRFQTQYIRVAPRAAFDALLFVDQINPGPMAGGSGR